MPYRREDSPIWWASYTDASGRRIRRPTGTEDHKEAKALEAKWKLQAHQEKQWDAEPVRTFDQLMLPYLQAIQNEIRSTDRYRDCAKRLYEVFSGRVLSELNAADIRNYIAKRRQDGRKNATINRELSVLSSAINYARREWDWEIPNPVLGRKPRNGEGRVRWLTQAQAQALIRAAESHPYSRHLADFIRLALNTGCRKGELLGLEWSRVDLTHGLFYLEAEHTKGKRRASIPLNEGAREALLNRARFRATHCPDSRWVFCSKKGSRVLDVKTSFDTACRKAGIEDFRPHDLRHTCAAWLVQANVPLASIRDLLRHTTVQMTEKYAHLSPENVRAAVTVLDGNRSRFGHAKIETGGESLAN